MSDVTLYRKEIEQAAAEQGLDPDLVEAIVMVESSGQADAFRFEPGFWQRYLADTLEYRAQNPRRVSSSYGLMQVMFTTAKEVGFTMDPEYLFVPGLNLGVGCRFLRALLFWANGSVEKAVGAYNAGRGNWNSTPARLYVAKVLKALAKVRTVRHGGETVPV